MTEGSHGNDKSHEEDAGAFPWHLGVFDAHCHPTDTLSTVAEIPTMNATAFTIMATRAQDQHLVEKVARDHGMKDSCPTDSCSLLAWRGVVPSFGWHPWFSHQLFHDAAYAGTQKLSESEKVSHYQKVLTPASPDKDFLLALPDPRPLSTFLAETKSRLAEFPAALIGEVGLDRAFRIPQTWLPEQTQERDDGLTPGGREGRRLSPYRVSMDHQRLILLAQLRLAGEMRRAASVHGVQAHGVVYETLSSMWRGHEREVLTKKERKRQAAAEATTRYVNDEQDEESKPGPRPYPPRICLHSYSGPAETLKQYFHPSVPSDIFLSFSTVINFSTAAAAKTEQVIRAAPEDRILVESDLHTAGERMDRQLEEIVRKVCELRGWTVEEGVKRLGDNWKRFVFGTRPTSKS